MAAGRTVLSGTPRRFVTPLGGTIESWPVPSPTPVTNGSRTVARTRPQWFTDPSRFSDFTGPRTARMAEVEDHHEPCDQRTSTRLIGDGGVGPARRVGRPSPGVPRASREWLFRHTESVGRRLRAVSSASGLPGAGDDQRWLRVFPGAAGFRCRRLPRSEPGPHRRDRRRGRCAGQCGLLVGVRGSTARRGRQRRSMCGDRSRRTVDRGCHRRTGRRHSTNSRLRSSASRRRERRSIDRAAECC